MKVSKVLIAILLAITFLFVFNGNVLAADNDSDKNKGKVPAARETWDMTDFDEFDDYDKSGKLRTATKNVMGTAIQVIRIVGTGIAIIMLTYVAIKYMTAAPTEKADFKKSATAYVVGAIVLFASTNILTIIANFAEQIK